MEWLGDAGQSLWWMFAGRPAAVDAPAAPPNGSSSAIAGADEPGADDLNEAAEEPERREPREGDPRWRRDRGQAMANGTK